MMVICNYYQNLLLIIFLIYIQESYKKIIKIIKKAEKKYFLNNEDFP